MARTNKTKNTEATPGFAIKLESATDLGLAMLIVESEDGSYEPVAVVSSISEAHEIAANDLRNRMQELERGKEPMCPAIYKVWAQGINGEYRVAATIPA
jgi:hypothetical protein